MSKFNFTLIVLLIAALGYITYIHNEVPSVDLEEVNRAASLDLEINSSLIEPILRFAISILL